jgi:hypothetical protein
MNEDSASRLEERSRRLFDDSVGSVDMRVRSRLTQARHAALEAAARPANHFLRFPLWTSAAGVTAAAVLGVAIWFGAPAGHHGMPVMETQSNLEDLDIVTASDESSGAPMEMLQDDIEFYDWAAAKTADAESGSVG